MPGVTVNTVRRTIRVESSTRDIKSNRVVRNIEVAAVGRRGPQGIQGIQGEPGDDATDKNFTQDFTNASSVSVIHNLSKYPAVTVLDTGGEEVEGTIEYPSTAQVVVAFSSSFSGRVICN